MNGNLVVVAADRLDRALAALVPERSRGEARRLIGAGAVFVNGKRCRIASKAVRVGDVVRVSQDGPIVEPESESSPDALTILFEDEGIVAIDKPARMPTAPTRQAATGSALDVLRTQMAQRDGRRQELWVVHRIDAGTSGVLLFAKTKVAAAQLSKLFAAQAIEKHYRVQVSGAIEADSGTIELPLSQRGKRSVVDAGGKPARTDWTVVERGAGVVWIDARPRTGRMHQIRVHFAAIGHSVVGDRRYGGPAAPRMMLHALSLSFVHPTSGAVLTIAAPPQGGTRA